MSECPARGRGGREGGKGHGHRHPRERPRKAMESVSHFHYISWKQPGRGLAKSFLGGFFVVFFFWSEIPRFANGAFGIGWWWCPAGLAPLPPRLCPPVAPGPGQLPMDLHPRIRILSKLLPGKLYGRGMGWPCPALRAGNAARLCALPRGTGRDRARAGSCSCTQHPQFPLEILTVKSHQFTESHAGRDLCRASSPTHPGGFGMSPKRGTPRPSWAAVQGSATSMGRSSPCAELGLAVFIYVQTLPWWVAALSPPVPLCGTCPQPCCGGTGPAWPGGHGAPEAQQGCAEGQHSPIPIPHPWAAPGNKHPDPP